MANNSDGHHTRHSHLSPLPDSLVPKGVADVIEMEVNKYYHSQITKRKDHQQMQVSKQQESVQLGSPTNICIIRSSDSDSNNMQNFIQVPISDASSYCVHDRLESCCANKAPEISMARLVDPSEPFNSMDAVPIQDIQTSLMAASTCGGNQYHHQSVLQPILTTTKQVNQQRQQNETGSTYSTTLLNAAHNFINNAHHSVRVNLFGTVNPPQTSSGKDLKFAFFDHSDIVLKNGMFFFFLISFPASLPIFKSLAVFYFCFFLLIHFIMEPSTRI